MEMKARGAHIISVIEENDQEIKNLSDDYIGVPKASQAYSPHTLCCTPTALYVCVGEGL